MSATAVLRRGVGHLDGKMNTGGPICLARQGRQPGSLFVCLSYACSLVFRRFLLCLVCVCVFPYMVALLNKGRCSSPLRSFDKTKLVSKSGYLTSVIIT